MKHFVCAFGLLSFVSGCWGADHSTGQGAAGQGAVGTGVVTVPLTATGGLGTLYRVANANFHIRGPESVVLTPADDAAEASVELLPGSYTCALLDGWEIQRLTDDGWETVSGTLSGDAEVPFEIEVDETTEVVYEFRVNNEAIDFGSGDLEITVAIDEVPACQLWLWEDFADNAAQWGLGPEWGIGSATTSSGQTGATGPDPAEDHTDDDNNGVAGAVIGGNVSKDLHDYYYLTSPVIDVADADDLYVSFWRWLNSDYTPFMNNIVQVFDGAAWVTVFETGGAPTTHDTAWTHQELDVSDYASDVFQFRFGYNVASNGAYTVSGWNIDDISVYSTDCD